jgi:hypothetical protein
MSISGKYMTFTVGGVEVAGNYAWDADEGGDVLDATVGANNGWEKEDMGVQSLHVTVKGYMDLTDGVYVPIRRGTILSDVEFYRTSADVTPAFAAAEMLAARSRQGGEVRGKIEWNAELHSRGDVVSYNDPS